MRTKTIIWCALVGGVITAYVLECLNRPDSKTSGASLKLEAPLNKKVNFEENAGRTPLPTWKFTTYYDSEKQKNQMCKVQAEVNTKLDLTNMNAKKDKDQFKFPWTRAIKIINKLLAALWLSIFLQNTWTLSLYIFQLSRSGSRGQFFVNLALVYVLLTFAKLLLYLVAGLKLEWNIGNTKIAIDGLSYRYMSVAMICSITAMALALHRLG